MSEHVESMMPRCVASTSPADHTAQSFFKSAEWSPDGTTLLTNNEDNTLRSYVLPPTLLTSPSIHNLTPYTSLSLPVSSSALAFYPYYSLADVSTTLYLASLPDHPIRLQNSLHTSLVASYPLIHEPTERYITPASLSFIHNGARFLAGADGEIACFEVERVGEGPISRRSLKGGNARRGRGSNVGGMDMMSMGPGMEGIVSSMAISSEGILAAGTFSRGVGIIADEGLGECIAVFSLKDAQDQSSQRSSRQEQELSEQDHLRGTGITSLCWSPCGRYLYIAERQANSIQIYDIRGLGRRLGCLTGRHAKTNQRIGFDVVQDYEGMPAGMGGGGSSASFDSASPSLETREVESHDADERETDTMGRIEGGNHHTIWSGGTDGIVRAWTNPHHITSDTQAPCPTLGWKAHDDSIASTTFHPTANILASCSGQRHFSFSFNTNTESDDEDSGTNTISHSSSTSSSDSSSESGSSADDDSSDGDEEDNSNGSGSESTRNSNRSNNISQQARVKGDYSLRIWHFV